MDDFSQLNGLGKDLMERIQTYRVKRRDTVLQIMNEETKVAVKDTYRAFGKYYKEKLAGVFNEAVMEFYNAYYPRFYEREYGLFDILDIKTNADGMVITGNDYCSLFDESAMHEDRSGNEGLYDLVFVEGWHGGSTGTDAWGHTVDTPHYRVPYREEGDADVGFYRWGRQAVRTDSPYKIFKRELSVMEDGEIYQELERLAHLYNDQAVQRYQSRIPDALRRIRI